MDFARIEEPSVLLQEIEEARKFVAQQPRRKELLTLVDLSGIRFNDEVLKAFRDLNAHDEPFEKAAAVCGLSKIGAIAFRAQNLMSGGRLGGFEKKEDALKWLLAQARGKT
jgi:hypothetical protein